jgi:hypothetical protein
LSKKGIIAGFEPAEDTLKALIDAIAAWEALSGIFKKLKRVVPAVPAAYKLFNAKKMQKLQRNTFFNLGVNIWNIKHNFL